MSIEIIKSLLAPDMILITVLGTVIGTVFGAIPGLTGTIGVSLLLPLSFALEPQAGLLLLGGIYMGSMYGGSITAVLINVPGAPEATFTAVEGFPMTLNGESQRGLYHSIYACVFGGLIGVVTLIFFTPVLVDIAVKFGPPEMFLMGLAGLTVIGALAGGNDLPKSFFATGLGVLISCIGADFTTNINRFTFGISPLKGGVSLIAVVLGMFAVSEMLLNIGNKTGRITLQEQKKISRIQVLKEFLKYKFTLIRSTLLGVLIGVLPGVGGTTACFVAYGNAKTMSKRPQEFGKGSAEGIIANESANNAVVGSCLVPLLSLGIPGSGTAAIMLGALTVHGIIPGPELFTKHADVAYTFMYGMVGTVIVMGILGLFGVKLFAKVVSISLEYIIPITIVFSMLGAYADKNSIFDICMVVVLSVVAVLMKKNGFPVAPLVLGVVLGQLIEAHLRTSLVLAKAAGIHIVPFLLMRPTCAILIVLVMILLIFMFRINRKAAEKTGSQD